MSTGSRDPEHAVTQRVADLEHLTQLVTGFRLEVVTGADRGVVWQATTDRATVGVHPSCDLTLHESTVSRFHCEIVMDDDGARIRDLGSRNHTIVDGMRVQDAYLKRDSLLKLGHCELRFQYLAQRNRLPLSERSEFGRLIGHSVAMRGLFGVLERAAQSNVTILLQGETGTGKSETARAIHRESKRQDGSFVMLDCAAIPANLLESELFGNEKGAFTGATARVGSFEEADGGTIFLDEIGELPFDLQTKLLSVLENREVRRLGSNARRPVDVRVLAATNRDLREEVNAGRFREDLYYRLAVVPVLVPPLRARLDDLPDLTRGLLTRMQVSEERIDALMTQEFLQSLRASTWPGNVRELRNFLERYLVFEDLSVMDTTQLANTVEPTGGAGIEIDYTMSFSDARQAVLTEFERRYLRELLNTHDGKVSRAAAEAGIDRTYIYKLVRRHGLDK